VRCLFPTLLWTFIVSTIQAQHQEPSLIDRLLRPNMELRNSAQDKKFAVNSASVERDGTFSVPPNRTEKSFAESKEVSTAQFIARAYNSGAGVIIAAQNRSADKQARLEGSGVVDVHSTLGAHATVTTRTYTEQQPFAEQGKSQKLLDRRNPPLTIDQVRELLNKNK